MTRIDANESFDEAARIRNLFLMISMGTKMTRDEDLIRKLMFEMEADPEPVHLYGLTHSSSEEERIEYYHLKLAVDEGLLEETGRGGGVFRMTNKGHDFVSAVRRDDIWGKAKGAFGQVGGVSLSMLKDVALGYVRQELRARGVPIE